MFVFEDQKNFLFFFYIFILFSDDYFCIIPFQIMFKFHQMINNPKVRGWIIAKIKAKYLLKTYYFLFRKLFLVFLLKSFPFRYIVSKKYF